MQRILVLLTITLLLGLGVRAFAQTEPPTPSALPTLSAEIWLFPVREKPEPIRKLVVTLINSTDKPITVVTEHLHWSAFQLNSAKGMTLTVGLHMVMKKDGRLVPPSLPKLAPVELFPGEAATIFADPDGRLERDLAAGKTLAKVEYEVTPFWGERLKVWHGKVECDPVVRDMATTKPVVGKADAK